MNCVKVTERLFLPRVRGEGGTLASGSRIAEKLAPLTGIEEEMIDMIISLELSLPKILNKRSVPPAEADLEGHCRSLAA